MKSFKDVLNGRMRTGKGCFVLASVHRPITEEGILRRVSVSIFKINK